MNANFKDVVELPIMILATLREITKRHGNMTYEECDKIAAEVMKKTFEEYENASEAKLLETASHVEDMTKGATLLSELRDAL